MTRSGDAAGLRGLLREELGGRLTPAGWAQVDVDPPFELAAFVRPLDGEFAATAEVGCASSIPDRPFLSTSGETLTIEESMNLEGENGERWDVGDEHEWSCG